MDTFYISDNSTYVWNVFVVRAQFVCESKIFSHGFLCDCHKAIKDECVQIIGLITVFV